MAKKIIVGNWKMNPVSPREATELAGKIKKSATGLKNTSVIICPPAVFISDIKKSLGKSPLYLGAQDAFSTKEGAYTGFISPYMMHNAGAEYVILGHSERRSRGESDETINEKIKLAIKAGLQVILCVGESERDEHGKYLATIKYQLERGLADLPKAQVSKIIIAHEPVWAIGSQATGADTPENFQHNSLFIKKVISDLVGSKAALSIPVLYGGSVSPQNASAFLDEGRADGLLVGRASLRADLFAQIIKLAEGKPESKVKSKR